MELNKLCFLCFQKCQSPTKDDTDNQPNFQKISLQSVLHYLTGEYGGRGGGGGDDVVVCTECHKVASTLSRLCVQLQEIQLKIEHFLGLFSEKLCGRRGSLDEGEGARGGSWNEQALNMYRSHILQKCRTKLGSMRRPVINLEKLAFVPVPVQKIEVVPRLEEEDPLLPQDEDEMVYDDDDDEMEKSLPPPQTPPAFQMEFCEEPVTMMIIKPPPPSTQNGVVDDEDEENLEQVFLEEEENVDQLEESCEEDSPPVLSKEIPSPKLPQRTKKRGRPRVHPPKLSRSCRIFSKLQRSTQESSEVDPCPTCGIEFSSKWERRNHLYTHRLPRTLGVKKGSHRVKCPDCVTRTTWVTVTGGDKQMLIHKYTCHLDLLFSSSKLEEIPSPLFNDYCKHLLYLEGVSSKVTTSSSSIQYTCQYCEERRQSPFKAYSSLRSHLIEKHKEILSRKLEQLQKDIPADKVKQVYCPRVRDDIKCADCGATFSQSGSLKRHLLESCPFRKDKSVNGSNPCRCQECGMRFRVRVSFYLHRRKEHPNSTKPPIMLKK